MKHNNNLNKNTLAIALSLAFPAYAVAQVAPAPEPKMARVEVTGSSIKRTEAEAAGSVQVLTREDIEKTGQMTALGILTSTAAIDTDLNSATASSGSFATGASGVSMRGLTKVSTLVLVNGRRIAPYGLADGAQENFTNLDAIASDAIERIEILKDGASAIYGSDAIAGVVNIILRRDFQGARVRTQYQEAQHFHDLRSRNVSAIVGYGDLAEQGFNTYLTAEAYKRDGYSQGEIRPFYPEWHRQTPGRSTWDAKSSFSPTGNYFRSSTNIVGAPGCPPENIDPTDKLCKWDVLPYTGITTDNKRHAIASMTHFRIGSVADATFEITTAGTETDYIVAPFSVSNQTATSATSIWYDVYGGKMVGPFSYPKLPVGHPMNPYNVPTEYRARMMDTGNGFNFNRTEADQSRVMLSLQGTIGTYDWRSAVGWTTSNATKSTRAVSARGYTDAILNRTYKFGQQNDPALLEAMFPVRTTEGESDVKFFDATVEGTLLQLPAGPLKFALGTDVRSNGYWMKSSENVLRGELVGVFGLQVDDRVSQYALFAETAAPLSRRIELQAALRADKTDGFEAHLSPKLGLKYTVTDSLLLRATASGGFRAPNIVESGNGLGRSSVAGSVVDPRRCPIANQLNALVQGAAGATTADKAQANSFRSAECLANLPSFVSSNPDLKPETSRSFTGGLVFQPVKNWSTAIDYYFLERRNEIGTRAITDILKSEADLPAGQLIRVDNSATDNEFLALVRKYAPNNTLNYGGVGQLGMLYNPYVNSGRTRVSGLDFDATGRFKLGGTDVRLKLDGTYVLKFQQYSVAANAYDPDQAGTYDFGSRLALIARAYVKQGEFDHGLTWNYSSGYSNNSLDQPTYCVTQKVAAQYMEDCERVGHNTTVDYSLAYSGIPHVRLSFYVNNLFNEKRPIAWRGGWSATSPQFRTFALAASYTF
ncbi:MULTISPECIES: TonB-dependent receptor domain-containing protein [unclassified Massilia]|uniref:TonB-dependent receptor domain-containing protein n=1 Tax=unclassified Massilia TaxID=2609279 RepID=UPI001E40B554|nr:MULTISPECIES: TonB-dependent receptor [unclassified Massilia]